MVQTVYGDMTLRPYQVEAVENIKDHIRKQLRGEIELTPAFFEGYVGCGKSLIIAALCHYCESVGARVLVLTRQGEIVEQDADEIVAIDAHCSVYSASLGTKSTHFSTVVGTEGTVVNSLDDDFNVITKSQEKGFVPHIILIDECHMLNNQDLVNGGDTQYSRILQHFYSVNNRLVVFGFTGSPYRGVESILGVYWKKRIDPVVGREFLVENKYLVPTIFGFGHDDAQYDLSDFAAENEIGTMDFTASQMEEMHKRMAISTTKTIMNEVQGIMSNRLSALITCAGKKHCDEAAACVPPDEMAIITESTPQRDRQDIIRDAKKGVLNDRGTFRYKYIFQIAALTTGINNTLWDTSVILRKIGSLTLLTQLLGRGMRLLKDELSDAGYVKHEHMVLDYSQTMSEMAQLFHDPILEEAMRSKDDIEKNFKTCPECNMMVGEHARRCQCGHWFKYRECEDTMQGGVITEFGCGAKNDIAARVCSNCGKYLINPNDKLSGKHYSDSDWKPVIDMRLFVDGRNKDAIKVVYLLDSYGLDGTREVAEVFFWAINTGGKQAWKSHFCMKHIVSKMAAEKFAAFPPIKAVAEQHKFLITPKFITHRKIKGKSVVNGVDFTGIMGVSRGEA